jgi:hypothetical protein
MTWQRSGAFAEGLLKHGVKSIVVGHLAEEWYLYSIAHPINTVSDIAPNLERYYEKEMVHDLIGKFEPLTEDASAEACARRYGEILCDGQVRLPVRLLVRDLLKANFPVLRYYIQWLPEDKRTEGK